MAEKKTTPGAHETINKEKTVRIRLPRERRDQDDKIVWVNARRFLIKRGVEVDVPECVAKILRNEEDMLQKAYEYEQKVQSKV